MRPPATRCGVGGSRRGSGILEVALVLPVLMITLLAIADLGRYVYATNLMPYLAREGARWASLEANRQARRVDAPTVTKYVKSLAAGLPEDLVRVETTLEPQNVGVRVSLIFQPVLNVFGGPITVQGHASMRRAFDPLTPFAAGVPATVPATTVPAANGVSGSK